MRPWFFATSFFAAALLFVVEPMVGKLLLPTLGGAPEVWIGCLVFFQVALLAGYAWAHALSSHVPRRAQPLAHAALVLGALALLPVGAAAGAPPPEQAMPVAWLFGRLATTVGLPFLAVSATGPLVQRWFSTSGRDPYPLYAASNLGSLVALLAYPSIVEPLLPLHAQTHLWSRGYLVLLLLLAGCALFSLSPTPSPSHSPSHPPSHPPSTLYWLALAFVPSSLMLGVTSFVTTDLAPVPLLWVVPLALYLVAFAIPFTARPPISHERAVRALPVAVLLLAFALVVGSDRLLLAAILVHFGAFFVIALACHGELARTRPEPAGLTRFYLVVSAGGALGGVFNAVVAPIAFPGVWEYPLAVVFACLLRERMGGASVRPAPVDEVSWEDEALGRQPSLARRRLRSIVRRFGFPVVAFSVLTLLLRALQGTDETWRVFVVAQVVAAACMVAWVRRVEARPFAWMVAGILAAPVVAALLGRTLFLGRSFFAVHRVVDDPVEHRHLYVQGTTVHGLQSTLPDRRRIAAAYFHSTGPAGDVLTHLAPRHAGLIGLGVASLATYAETNERFTFFEIDPMVERIAEDTRFFSFLADARSRGATVEVVLGDARLRLGSVPDQAFDLLVLDAYSSDVVPIHLLTREALALYLRTLAPGGLLLMNISNRYLDLGRVVAGLAVDARLVARERLDELSSEEDKEAARRDGKAVSRWIVLARAEHDLDALDLGPSWKPLEAPGRTWTDDYVNVLSCVRW